MSYTDLDHDPLKRILYLLKRFILLLTTPVNDVQMVNDCLTAGSLLRRRRERYGAQIILILGYYQNQVSHVY